MCTVCVPCVCTVCVLCVISEELGRRLDNKRKEIASAEKCRRELENKLHSLKKDKVSSGCSLVMWVWFRYVGVVSLYGCGHTVVAITRTSTTTTSVNCEEGRANHS